MTTSKNIPQTNPIATMLRSTAAELESKAVGLRAQADLIESTAPSEGPRYLDVGNCESEGIDPPAFDALRRKAHKAGVPTIRLGRRAAVERAPFLAWLAEHRRHDAKPVCRTRAAVDAADDDAALLALACGGR